MRSILLPVTPNYVAVGLWYKFFQRWQHEVDRVEICFNDTLFGEGFHGNVLKRLVNETKADYVMLAEFDGIVFKEGFVDKYFKMLEEGEVDLIGSPRMSCSQEVAEAAKAKFGLDYEGPGDKGPHFWPNFLFIKTETLKATDMNFCAFVREKGEYIEELDYTVKTDDFRGDTFTWTSLQLRAMGLKIHEINQYHSHPTDLEDYKNNLKLWDGNCDRLHMGSLSGNLTLSDNEMEKRESERRLMWLELGGKDIQPEIEEYELSRKRIDEMGNIYKRLVQWT